MGKLLANPLLYIVIPFLLTPLMGKLLANPLIYIVIPFSPPFPKEGQGWFVKQYIMKRTTH